MTINSTLSINKEIPFTLSEWNYHHISPAREYKSILEKTSTDHPERKNRKIRT
ncbi:MAG: hypothetical protein HN646_01685 [Nitrospina sp.]|nr:hypothetical protein [Nitrospina sp.]